MKKGSIIVYSRYGEEEKTILRALTKDFIMFGKVKNPANTICPLTSKEFKQLSIISFINPCRHVFIYSALRGWLQNELTCPVCNLDLEKCYNVTIRNKEQKK